ncbi:hypothetical protein C3B79_0247 [Aeromonas hydrophila]|nr:hypothetical protein C3B79_0247 [Aeromonas hydrophila]
MDDFSRGHLGHDGVPVSGAGRAHPLENGVWLAALFGGPISPTYLAE